MNNEPFNYAIALTGGIATGKSTVVELFKESGFHVIDADEVAHEVLDSQHEAIAEMFGEVFVKDAKVDRKNLGAVIFSDQEKRKALEDLLHPLIYARIAEKSEVLDKHSEPYLVDIPLFFEGGRYGIDKVVVVYAEKEQQLQRLMERESYTKEEALSRMAAQIDIEEKRKNALYVIHNTGSLEQLAYEVTRVKEEILGEYR